MTKTHEVGTVPKELMERLYWGIATLKLCGLPFSGELGELLYSEGAGLQHLTGNEKVIDAVGNKTAVSIKIHMCKDGLKCNDSIDIIAGRMGVNGTKIKCKGDTSSDNIGKVACKTWNDNVNRCRIQYPDLRMAIIMYDRNLRNIGLIEKEIGYLDPETLIFEETKSGGVMAKDKETNKKVFTLTASGGHFTLHIDIPKNFWKTSIKDPIQLTKDQQKKLAIEHGIEDKEFSDFTYDTNPTTNSTICTDEMCSKQYYQDFLDL